MKTHKIVYVQSLPQCDICNHRQAHYDAKTIYGAWANLCPECMAAVGVGLGLGCGQELVCESSFQKART